MAKDRDADYFAVRASHPTLNLINIMYRCRVDNMVKRGYAEQKTVRRRRRRA